MPDVKHSTTAIRSAVVVGALLLAVAGCGGSAKKPAASPTSQAPTQSTAASGAGAIASQPMALNKGTARVDLLAVDRSAANTVTLRWRVTNISSQQVNLEGAMERESAKFKPDQPADGVSLVDATANKRYFPLYDTAGACLCPSHEATKVDLDPGKSAEFYAVLPAPAASLQQIAVMIPLTPLFQAVPIGSSPRPFSGTEIDPAKASLGAPDIVSLISTAEGTIESTDDSGASRSVRLSADVLFAINKSNLTPAAQSVLKQVAQQIDASTGATVTVDGYTDNSGNDAINNPLSVARARAVASQVKLLVTRQGVSYQAAGHGSGDPVADNGSEEGRRKNRRVTVTFARPAVQASSGSGSAAPAAPAPAWTGGKLPVAATATPLANNVKGLKLEINSVHRDATGLTTMTWTLTNTASTKFGVGFTFVDRGQEFNYDGLNVPGARLVDQAGKLTYSPLRDEGKECICTNLNKGKGNLDPGESVTYFDSYELPPGAASVDVTFPFFAPAQHVQVQ